MCIVLRRCLFVQASTRTVLILAGCGRSFDFVTISNLDTPAARSWVRSEVHRFRATSALLV